MLLHQFPPRPAIPLNGDMTRLPCTLRLPKKAWYLLLLVLCLCVLAWFSTLTKTPLMGSTKEQDEVQVGNWEWPDRKEEEKEREDETRGNKEAKTDRESCPEHSALLRGDVKLSFEPSLTLSQVQEENTAVSKGQYEPPDCVARESVAILIPHRNREKHLLYLLHHLHPFLQRQQLHYGIYVIHQAGESIFNRAKLLNVGFLEARKDFSWKCFIFHDVDLVPENDRNLYTCDFHPKHLVVGRNSTGYRLRYKGYFGGVTAMTTDQFLHVNGFSNTYWGWGGEDDDLRIRVQLRGMKVVRPPSQFARYTMIFHKRDSGNEVNKDRMTLLTRVSKVWKKDGLNSCSYKKLSLERLPLYTNITVDIGKPSKLETQPGITGARPQGH